MSESLDSSNIDEQESQHRDLELQKREVADHQVLPDQESPLQLARTPCQPSDLLHQEQLSEGDLTELHLY